MKRRLYLALCMLTLSGILSACGSSFKAAEDAVYVTKDGSVIGASIEDFNEDYYDEEELKDYITESVEDYVSKNGDDSVTLDSFEVEENGEDGRQAALYLKYDSYIDYAQFNGVTMYAGTVAEAREAGYDFDGKFKKAEEGQIQGDATAEDILADEDANVVFLGQEISFQVDGKILFVSDGNVELTGKNTAKIQYDREDADAKLACLIYK